MSITPDDLASDDDGSGATEFILPEQIRIETTQAQPCPAEVWARVAVAAVGVGRQALDARAVADVLTQAYSERFELWQKNN